MMKTQNKEEKKTLRRLYQLKKKVYKMIMPTI